VISEGTVNGGANAGGCNATGSSPDAGIAFLLAAAALLRRKR